MDLLLFCYLAVRNKRRKCYKLWYWIALYWKFEAWLYIAEVDSQMTVSFRRKPVVAASKITRLFGAQGKTNKFDALMFEPEVGSKCTVLKKLFVTLLGHFDARGIVPLPPSLRCWHQGFSRHLTCCDYFGICCIPPKQFFVNIFFHNILKQTVKCRMKDNEMQDKDNG